jgi:hypothetical protein
MIDVRSLVAFRVLFGAIMATGALRMLWSGWIDVFFVAPGFFFKYPGFEWIEPLSRSGMYALYSVLFVLALCIAAGAFYRLACVAFAIAFAYAQLIDVTNYLNHYYLVVLVSLELAFVPAHAAFSVDAWRDTNIRRSRVPALALHLLRFQFAVVYVFAGLAKLNGEWLLRAQPLKLWLAARDHLPIIGPALRGHVIAYLASWGAFLYDTTIPLWLSIPRTRKYAFAAVLGFHTMTFVFFDIGLFPFIMTAGATLFFSPSWPRFIPVQGGEARLPHGAWRAAFLALALVQVAVPMRAFIYGKDVLWDEDGMRFSWKVLVREKSGSVSYRVETSQRSFVVSPHEYLTWRQTMEMAGQPDLIAQLARHIAADYRERGFPEAHVYADAWVSMNGARRARLIDPTKDLSMETDGYVLPRTR